MIRVIIPALGGGSYAYFASRLAFRYAELGSSPQDIMATAVRHPGRIAHLLFQAQKLKFLAGIFGPVLGLSLISGFAVVLVIPTLALLLLSNYGPQSAFTSQYSAPLIPLVVGTSILGFARLRPSIQRPVAGAVLLSSLAFAYLFGDLPFSRHFQAANFQTEPRYAAFVHNLDLIPPAASVAAENNLTPHLSHRRYIYDIEFEGTQHAEYLALDFATFGHDPTRFEDQERTVESDGYQEIAEGDGLALFHRP